MAETNGKTARLLNRLPHFYNPKELEKTFLNVYQTLGDSLEQCERDMFEVLKAHHVQTAENVGSKGYIAPAAEHGDLDKLFSLYLNTLGGTSQLVSMNPLFTTRSFDVEKLLGTLYQADEELFIKIKDLLILCDETARSTDPLETYLPVNIQFRAEEISGPFVFALLIRTSPITAYIADALSENTNELLFAYEGKGQVSSELAVKLIQDLNQKVLKDPFLFRNNYDYFRQFDLSQAAIELRNSLNKDYLKHRYSVQFENYPEDFNNNIVNLQSAISELEFTELPAEPVMHDMIRLNRMLLDHAAAVEGQPGKSWSFKRRTIPNRKTVRKILKDRINALLQSTSDEVNALFDDLLGTILDSDNLTKQYHDDRLMLRRFLLESVFPYEVKHIYRMYQDRLQALIKVLRKGASTKQGILDIVAANFGMIDDTPEVMRSKELIQIKEFDPEEQSYADIPIPLLQPFQIFNDNQDPTLPKIKVTMLSSRITSIRNIKLIDATNNNAFTVPFTMKAGDTFLLQDGDIIFNGVLSTKKVEGDIHYLPARQEVKWMIDAEILSNTDDHYGPYGEFDSTTFGDAMFINEEEPVVQVEVLSFKLTYGALSIRIPWHIEGVTDNFAETRDHPRHQIKSLASKVKAAGVRVRVSYLQDFSESHEYSDQLHFGLHGGGFSETQELEDDFTIDSRLGKEEQHELSDGFRTSGVFDYTRFGSGNTFE